MSCHVGPSFTEQHEINKQGPLYQVRSDRVRCHPAGDSGLTSVSSPPCRYFDVGDWEKKNPDQMGHFPFHFLSCRVGCGVVLCGTSVAVHFWGVAYSKDML